jgi:hypothetical protein
LYLVDCRYRIRKRKILVISGGNIRYFMEGLTRITKLDVVVLRPGAGNLDTDSAKRRAVMKSRY